MPTGMAMRSLNQQ